MNNFVIYIQLEAVKGKELLPVNQDLLSSCCCPKLSSPQGFTDHCSQALHVTSLQTTQSREDGQCDSRTNLALIRAWQCTWQSFTRTTWINCSHSENEPGWPHLGDDKTPSSRQRDKKNHHTEGGDSFFRERWPLQPMMKLILSFGQQRWSQFNGALGNRQEQQGWISAVSFSPCSLSGLNPPLSAPCRNRACINQSVFLFYPMLPMGFSPSGAHLSSPALVAISFHTLTSVCSFLNVSFPLEIHSSWAGMLGGGGLGLLAWIER